MVLKGSSDGSNLKVCFLAGRALCWDFGPPQTNCCKEQFLSSTSLPRFLHMHQLNTSEDNTSVKWCSVVYYVLFNIVYRNMTEDSPWTSDPALCPIEIIERNPLTRSANYRNCFYIKCISSCFRTSNFKVLLLYCINK